MCGITGIIRKDLLSIDERQLRRMNDLAQHRGPDGSGLLIKGNVGLGHRRLAIIDLDVRGRQPMEYLDGRFHITYNGEIYNYRELRDELEGGGHRFKTRTDTEVILAAFAEWGVACLPRFNGMWAFAILDQQSRKITLARDRFGVKPLYYQDAANAFTFASEIKQLIEPGSQPRHNRGLVLDYLIAGHENHTNETFFEGINCLPPGSFMVVSDNGKVQSCSEYYNLRRNEDYQKFSFGESVDAVQHLLRDSIRLRLRSDVMVGTCLSGGLDSSTISALASRSYQDDSNGARLLAIHSKSTELRSDESKFASKVADASNLELVVVEPSSNDFISSIDDVVYTQEEPFGSPSMFMGWHIFREASRRQCRVMLNGQGCDEVFLGYERYYPLELQLSNPIAFARKIYDQSRNSRLSALEALQYYLYFRLSGPRIARLKSNKYIHPIFLREYAFDSVVQASEKYCDSYLTQKLEIDHLQLPHLLRYEDRNSMRHGIETRLPFLDYRLVELGISIPLSHKIAGGWTKYVVRKAAAASIPSEIAWRKEKIGFESPTQTWFTEYASGMYSEIQNSDFLQLYVDTKKVLANFSEVSLKQKWALFNLAAWARIYKIAG